MGQKWGSSKGSSPQQGSNRPKPKTWEEKVGPSPDRRNPEGSRPKKTPKAEAILIGHPVAQPKTGKPKPSVKVQDVKIPGLILNSTTKTARLKEKPRKRRA